MGFVVKPKPTKLQFFFNRVKAFLLECSPFFKPNNVVSCQNYDFKHPLRRYKHRERFDKPKK